MGKELDCSMQYQGANHVGRVYLESDFLLFRGDVRLKILLGQLTSVSSVNGWLRVKFDGKEAGFEIGAGAAKWADKILHPPSRLVKLGVHDEMRVLVIGKFDDDFQAELGDAGIQRVESDAELIFLAAQQSKDVRTLSKIKSKLRPKCAVWIVYPKGIDAIREIDVIGTGRSNGLKDTKVVAFSKTHTALRFLKS